MRSTGKPESSGSSSPAPFPVWIHDLEELRGSVISRLLAIEQLARQRSSVSSPESVQLVQSLRARIEELELDRSRLLADAERGEGDWKRLQDQFENDRQLLAEAWERLERERLESGGNAAVGPARQAPGANRRRTPEEDPAHIASPQRHAAGGETGNPVAETILRQFQVLCGDVRRTSDARCSSG